MSLSVVFGNPRTNIFQPGAYTLVDASQLATAPPFVYNTVCVMGAGLGGTPLQPYVMNDPVQAQLLFGAQSPLYEAIRLAFMGGANGGAATVVAVRVDDTAQAVGGLVDSNTGTGISATFKDSGAYGNTYTLSFLPGSVQGTMAVLQGKYLDGRDFIQRWDNEPSFSRLLERITLESPVNVALTAGGVRASQTLTIATSQVDGRAVVTDSQGTQRTTQAHIYQYPLTLREAPDSMLVTFNSVTSWAVSAIDAGADTFTATAHGLTVGNYVTFSGATLPTGINATTTYVVMGAPDADTFTVQAIATPIDFVVSAINDGSDLLTAPGHTLANGDVVQLFGTTAPTGITQRRNYFVVNVNGNDFQVASTVGGSAIAIGGSIAGLTVRRIAAAGVVNISGSVSGASVHLGLGRAAISGSAPNEFNGGRDALRTVPAYSQAYTDVAISASAYGSDSARWTLPQGQTWGHSLGRGLPGAIFTIASGVYQGTYQILHQEWDGLSADRTRIVRKLGGDRRIAEGTLATTLVFYPAYLFGRTQPAQVALESALPGNGLLATGGQFLSAVLGETTINYSTLPGDTIEGVGQQIAALINQNADSPVTASAAYNLATYTTTLTLSAKNPGAASNQVRTNLLINVQSLVLVARGGATLVGGVDPLPPRNAQGVTSGVITFSGGFDSVPTLQRWLAGLEVIKFLPVRWLVPAGTDNLGVQQAFADHCALMSTTAQRRERLCVLGHGLGWSKDRIRERAQLFQSERVIFVSPGIVTADAATGNPRTYPATYTAAMVAGMLAAEGNGISDPITNTFLRNVQGLELTYQPGSVDLDVTMQAGVLTLERDPSVTRASRGFRVTRGITTWRVTGQSSLKSGAFSFITTVNQSDYCAAFIRDMQDQLFIGRGIFQETPEQVRVATNAALAQLVKERALFGYDPQFTQVTVNAQNQQALDCVYRIYPAPNLDFVLNTQVLLPLSMFAA